MSRRKKRKNRSAGGEETIELVLMPFIDVFSLLTTFLLFSAVFVHIGVLEVQVPFLSNAAPPKANDQTRVISIKADVRKDSIEIITSWSKPPINEKKYMFEHNEKGIAEMHQRLVQIRVSNPTVDLVTLFTDDDVTFEKLVLVLDSIKLLSEGDPAIPVTTEGAEAKNTEESRVSSIMLYPKVVMGSVLL